jgi:hypothetical protein
VFEKNNINVLPKHQPYDCTIDLEKGTQLPFEPIYNLSKDKFIALHGYINKNIDKGFIRHFKSPLDALIFFVKKKYGSSNMCDYHGSTHR